MASEISVGMAALDELIAGKDDILYGFLSS
jgi:hypothetical protein